MSKTGGDASGSPAPVAPQPVVGRVRRGMPPKRLLLVFAGVVLLAGLATGGWFGYNYVQDRKDKSRPYTAEMEASDFVEIDTAINQGKCDEMKPKLESLKSKNHTVLTGLVSLREGFCKYQSKDYTAAVARYENGLSSMKAANYTNNKDQWETRLAQAKSSLAATQDERFKHSETSPQMAPTPKEPLL